VKRRAAQLIEQDTEAILERGERYVCKLARQCVRTQVRLHASVALLRPPCACSMGAMVLDGIKKKVEAAEAAVAAAAAEPEQEAQSPTLADTISKAANAVSVADVAAGTGAHEGSSETAAAAAILLGAGSAADDKDSSVAVAATPRWWPFASPAAAEGSAATEDLCLDPVECGVKPARECAVCPLLARECAVCPLLARSPHTRMAMRAPPRSCMQVRRHP
jgi:hypothetical protein